MKMGFHLVSNNHKKDTSYNYNKSGTKSMGQTIKKNQQIQDCFLYKIAKAIGCLIYIDDTIFIIVTQGLKNCT